MNVYAGADAIIKEMNRANLKAFNMLKLAKWDELNVIGRKGSGGGGISGNSAYEASLRLINMIAAMYDKSIRLAKKKYLMCAHDAYVAAMIECHISDRRATDMAFDDITVDWVLDMLEEIDPVTLYAFLPEAERKKERLTETLAVTHNRDQEIDRALRAWTKQVAQYADNSVDYARRTAFEAAGIKRVRWHTQEDDRVCTDCEPLDGRIFEINQIPPRPHWGCRCWVEPILN